MSDRMNEESLLRRLKQDQSHITVVDSDGEEHFGPVEWSDVYNIAIAVDGQVRVFAKANIRFFEYAK